MRNSVKHYFQKEPMEGVNPDQVVSWTTRPKLSSSTSRRSRSNGIVNVQAADRETGERTSTTISPTSGLSEKDILDSMQSNRDTRLVSQDLPSPGR